MDKRDETPKDNDALNEINRQLDNAEEQGMQLLEKGRELTTDGQFMVDFSRSIRDAIHVIGIPNNIEGFIQDLNSYNRNAGSVLIKLDGTNLSGLESTGGTVAFTASGTFDPYMLESSLAPDQWNYAKPTIERVHEVTARLVNKDQATQLMQDFGLASAAKYLKSPLELFETAHRAFEMPVIDTNPISTSLIPIRESIRLMIDYLLAERPKQEPAGNERAKIKSIASQLKKDIISDEVVESWIDQWVILLDKYLSPAKDHEISRGEWQYRLNQATLFLISLLTGLDKSKLRTNLKDKH